MTYKLKDLAGDVIKGTFYSDELQMITKPDDTLFDRTHSENEEDSGQGRVSGQVARIS